MWSFNGGTGKLKGLKGKGTYQVNTNADGSATVDVKGRGRAACWHEEIKHETN
jgi:hypothetical protein